MPRLKTPTIYNALRRQSKPSTSGLNVVTRAAPVVEMAQDAVPPPAVEDETADSWTAFKMARPRKLRSELPQDESAEVAAAKRKADWKRRQGVR